MLTNPPNRDTAIKLALNNKWEEAALENERLLAENPHDIDTLNRLAFSQMKLGKFKKSKENYQAVVALDKTNPIALKNLKRIDTISKSSTPHSASKVTSMAALQDLYIEEAGKTKTVELKNVADKNAISLLEPGEEVALVVKRLKVFVQMMNHTYIGVLPDNVGMRMIDFINGGNEYSACIKAARENSVIIFIRETKRVTKFKNQPSFVHIPLADER